MDKDFLKWHALKAQIDEQGKGKLYRAQEVWWCSLGSNVGVETDGKQDLFQRPVLVFRKFNQDMFWGLPMTLKQKGNRPFYFSFTFQGKQQVIVLSQLRSLSSKRLIRHMGKLSDNQFAVVDAAFEKFLKRSGPLAGSSGA